VTGALDRVALGATTVTRLGFGGAPLGNLFTPIAEEAALAAVRRACDLALHYVHTAPHYGQELSEHRLGHVLRAVPRAELTLSTKVGRLMEPDPDRPRDVDSYVDALPFRPRYDYSADGTLRSIEHSLMRLGLARIDVVWIHDIDVFTHGADQPRRFREAMEGAYPALHRLRAAGTIGAIGLGVNDWRVCRDALAHADLDGFLLAGRYTLLDQSALAELLPLCAARGARLVIGGPYNSGILASGAVAGATYDYKPASPEILARVAAIEAVAKEHAVPLRAAALQFVFGHPTVACVIPGARGAAEVEENMRLLSVEIPAAFWAALKAGGLLDPAVPTP